MTIRFVAKVNKVGVNSFSITIAKEVVEMMNIEYGDLIQVAIEDIKKMGDNIKTKKVEDDEEEDVSEEEEYYEDEDEEDDEEEEILPKKLIKKSEPEMIKEIKKEVNKKKKRFSIN